MAPLQRDREGEVFHLDTLLAEREVSGRLYHEFLQVPSLRAGVYVLPVGGIDPQSAHAEDEVYYVVRGRSRFRAAGEEWEAHPGSIFYVKSGLDHRFFDIEEELAILVFFSAGV